MCLTPNYLVYETDVLTGERKIAFCGPVPLLDGCFRPDAFPVACGHCVECVQRYSLEWANRCLDELKTCDNIGFNVTLTYRDNPIELNKRDYQLFIKRLRKAIYPVKVRYFGCGEYGAHKGRPHFHINFFGWKPSDLTFWKNSKRGHPIYRSKFIEALWPLGFIAIEDITQETCLYSAKYMQKLLDYSDKKVRPFTFMSTSPGIGCFSVSDAMLSDRIYRNGKTFRVPRYYLKLLDKRGFDLSKLKAERVRLSVKRFSLSEGHRLSFLRKYLLFSKK